MPRFLVAQSDRITDFIMKTNNSRPVIRAANLADGVYEHLHSGIVLGKIQTNQLLLEEELAHAMEVSRTPVREALQRLANDGLVISRSRRWIVVEPTLEDIRDIYGVRSALEGYAARMCAQNATPEQVDRIKAALQDRTRSGSGAEDFVTSNERFHRTISEGAGNPRLLIAIESSRHFYFNARIARLYDQDHLAASNGQHRDLLNAIQRRDGDAAERIARDHIASALDVIETEL